MTLIIDSRVVYVVETIQQFYVVFSVDDGFQVIQKDPFFVLNRNKVRKIFYDSYLLDDSIAARKRSWLDMNEGFDRYGRLKDDYFHYTMSVEVQKILSEKYQFEFDYAKDDL